MDSVIPMYPNWELLRNKNYALIYNLVRHTAYSTKQIKHYYATRLPTTIPFTNKVEELLPGAEPLDAINRILQYIAILYNNRLLEYTVVEGVHKWKAVRV